jgi:hypothetical protein
MGELTAEFYRRTVHDGLTCGPGVLGIPEVELREAIDVTPHARDGVTAWVAEGGLELVPRAGRIWGVVSGKEYAAAVADDSTRNDLGYDGGYEDDGEDDDGESVPTGVKSQTQFYSHFLKYGMERVKAWSRWVGVAPDRAHYEQTMFQTRAVYDEFEHYLEQRHSTLTPDSFDDADRGLFFGVGTRSKPAINSSKFFWLMGRLRKASVFSNSPPGSARLELTSLHSRARWHHVVLQHPTDALTFSDHT